MSMRLYKMSSSNPFTIEAYGKGDSNKQLYSLCTTFDTGQQAITGILSTIFLRASLGGLVGD
jgi:hypothetical protein